MSGNARAAVLAPLGRRETSATVCPSEVARAMAGAAAREDWRGEMPAVHGAVPSFSREMAPALPSEDVVMLPFCET